MSMEGYCAGDCAPVSEAYSDPLGVDCYRTHVHIHDKHAVCTTSRMRVMNHNWSARKQCVLLCLMPMDPLGGRGCTSPAPYWNGMPHVTKQEMCGIDFSVRLGF